MKKFYFLLLLFTTVLSAQSYTEKWNDLYNRYEYFNSNGDMTGYKYYDNLYRVWKYKDLAESAKSNYVKPTNTALISRVLAAKDARYNSNVEKVQAKIDEIYEDINDLDLSYDSKINIKKKMNIHIKSLQNKKYDFSSSSTVNSMINWLDETYTTIARREFSQAGTTNENIIQKSTYDTNLQIGKYITTDKYTVIWDVPNMVKSKNIGFESSGTFILLEKTNSEFYKVQLGKIIGYIYIKNIQVRKLH